MRVTDATFYESNRRNIGARASELADAQEQAYTGRSVRKPSDDPLAMSLALRERSREGTLQHRLRSVDNGRMHTDAQDQALGEVGGVTHRALELAIQGASDTLSAPERSSLAREVDELRSAVIGLANTQVGGSFVFAGTADDAAPFDAAGAFVGNLEVPELVVGDGVRLARGVSTADAFDAGGPEDLIQLFADLRDALDADDEVAIRGSIEALQSAHARLSEARGQLGGLQNGLDVASAVTEKLRDAATARQSDLVGADPVDIAVELQRVQEAHATAIQIAGQLPPPGLVGGS